MNLKQKDLIYRIDDLFMELFNRNAELRIVDNLWSIADEIKQTTLNWSMCRMRNAQPRESCMTQDE